MRKTLWNFGNNLVKFWEKFDATIRRLIVSLISTNDCELYYSFFWIFMPEEGREQVQKNG